MNNLKKTELSSNIFLYENIYVKDDVIENISKNKNINWKKNSFPLSPNLLKNLDVSKYQRSNIRNNFERNIEVKLLTKRIGFSCLPAINDYIKYHGQNFKWVENSIFMKYEKGDFVNHNFYNTEYEHSLFCVMLSLNDDYLGGSVSFINYDVSIKIPKNSLIIFPNNEKYLYDIEKITYGTKYDYFLFLNEEKHENPYSKK